MAANAISRSAAAPAFTRGGFFISSRGTGLSGF